MSAFPDQPDHFWRWLCAWTVSLAAVRDPFCLVPRRIYGDYGASLIAPLLSNAERPGGLRIIRGECISIDPGRYGVAITLADGSCHHAGFAVLATGHETAACRTGCYVDPWTSPAMRVWTRTRES
jgi:uncharacterized NAD(P)/FAD-binding protein YdhS